MIDPSSDPARTPVTWFVTADSRGATLYESTWTPHGRLHLEARAQYAEQWEEHQHGRPSPRANKDGHSYASMGHEDEERIARLARELEHWVQQEAMQRGLARLHAFVSRPLFRLMRNQDRGRLLELECLDLAHVPAGDLVKHPAVRRACAPQEPAAPDA